MMTLMPVFPNIEKIPYKVLAPIIFSLLTVWYLILLSVNGAAFTILEYFFLYLTLLILVVKKINGYVFSQIFLFIGIDYLGNQRLSREEKVPKPEVKVDKTKAVNNPVYGELGALCADEDKFKELRERIYQLTVNPFQIPIALILSLLLANTLLIETHEMEYLEDQNSIFRLYIIVFTVSIIYYWISNLFFFVLFLIGISKDLNLEILRIKDLPGRIVATLKGDRKVAEESHAEGGIREPHEMEVLRDPSIYLSEYDYRLRYLPRIVFTLNVNLFLVVIFIIGIWVMLRAQGELIFMSVNFFRFDLLFTIISSLFILSLAIILLIQWRFRRPLNIVKQEIVNYFRDLYDYNVAKWISIEDTADERSQIITSTTIKLTDRYWRHLDEKNFSILTTNQLTTVLLMGIIPVLRGLQFFL